MENIGRLVLGDGEDPRTELVTLFGGRVPASGDAPREALDWGRGQVDVERMSEMEAIRALRAADPRLGLKSATYLAARLYTMS